MIVLSFQITDPAPQHSERADGNITERSSICKEKSKGTHRVCIDDQSLKVSPSGHRNITYYPTLASDLIPLAGACTFFL